MLISNKILRVQVKLKDSNAIQIKENQWNMSIQLQVNNPLLYFKWKISGLNDINEIICKNTRIFYSLTGKLEEMKQNRETSPWDKEIQDAAIRSMGMC